MRMTVTRRPITLLRTALVVASALAWAGAPPTVLAGPRSIAFADSDPGPRMMAMGGAGVAGVADPVAAWWNPAGLYFMQGGKQAQVDYDDAFGLGLARRAWLGLASKSVVDEPVFEAGRLRLVRRPGFGNAWALSVSTLSLDLGDESYNELMPGLSLAGGLGTDLAVGMSVYYLRAGSSLDAVSGNGYSTTFGVIAGLPGPGRLGLSVRHVLSALSWKDQPGDQLPITPTVGLYWPLGPRAQLRSDASWRQGDAGITRFSAGGEYWILPGHLAGRAGVRRMAAGLLERTVPTFGLGLRWKTLDLDYAFQSDSDGPGNTHRFGLNLELGAPAGP